MHKVNKIFNKTIGSVFGIMAWIVGLLSYTIAISLRIEVDPTFSLSSNYLCDLGIETYDSHFIFSIGCIIKQCFLIPFYLSLVILLQKIKYESYLIKIALAASIIYTLSLMIVIPFLLDTNNQFFCSMHGILGFMYFSFGTLAFTLYGIIELSNPKISNVYAMISFITAFFQGLFLFFSTVYIIEWFSIASDFSWLLTHAIFLLKNDSSIMENIVFFELDFSIKKQ